MKLLSTFCAMIGLLALSACATRAVPLSTTPPMPSAAAIDTEVAGAMAATSAKGLALAVIENGRPVHVKSYGVRNAAGDPLQTNTVMYGASLTKAVFAYTVMQLVDEGLLELDVPIERYLSKPLPAYAEQEVEDRYAQWCGPACKRDPLSGVIGVQEGPLISMV